MGRTKSTTASLRKSAAYVTAAKCKDTQSLEILHEFWREEGMSPFDNRGDTILHFIAIHGNVNALRLLIFDEIRPVKSEDLKIKNMNGDTPLHEAARFGQIAIVEMMLTLEKELVMIRNNLGETPLYVAAATASVEKEVFTLLDSNNFCDEFTRIRDDGSTVLHAAVTQECYYFALQLLKIHPELASKKDRIGRTALNILATKHLSFRSGTSYNIGQLGTTPFVPMQVFETFIYFCIPSMYQESPPAQPGYNLEDPRPTADVPFKRARSPLINFLLGNAWLGEIDYQKQKHILALILARRLIEQKDWSSCYADCMPNPIVQAAKLGINELVVEIVENCPEAIETLDEDGKNILHIAAEQKNRFLFDYLLEKIAHSDRMIVDTDSKGNTIMHFAATAGSPFKFPIRDPNEARGYKTLVFIPWGVLWFKRVKYCVPPCLWTAKNNEGITANELFERNHSNIRKEAEKTIRELGNSTLVLATLLYTINFAAVFTVPGQFDDKSGLPVLLKKEERDLWVLMFFIGSALYDAVFTMGTLNSILLSKFDSDDYYIVLPVKCCTVFISVYYSTACTVLACVQALNLENIFKNKDVPWLIITMFFLGSYMTLLVVDICYMPFDYMYYFVRYSLSYKRKHV